MLKSRNNPRNRGGIQKLDLLSNDAITGQGHEASMEELTLFSQLVEGIYDSSLDASLWPEVLQQICVFVRGCAIALNYSNFAPSPSFFHSWGYEPRFLQLYQDVYSKLNPFFPAFLFLNVGEVYCAHEIVPMEEFRSTRLYKEWARPQGFLDAMQTNLERTANGVAVISVHGRERDGLFDDDAKARLTMLVPHVRRAIAIGKVVEFHKAHETALASTLDGLDAAVMLVAQDGRLVHLNAAGTAMLTTADVLRAPKGRLSAVDPRANSELQQAISAAARGDAGLGIKGMSISLSTERGTSQVAHVLSLMSGKRRVLLQGQSVAAVFVRSTISATPAPLEIVAQRYDLTAGEVRVLASLAASSSVSAMARMLGVGEATVKTHLNRLFSKTGTKRQVDLVKLLAMHGTPLAL